MTVYEEMAQDQYLTPPTPRKGEFCDRCGGEMRGEEPLYFWGEEWICPECFRDEIGELTIDELAEMLGVGKKVAACR